MKVSKVVGSLSGLTLALVLLPTSAAFACGTAQVVAGNACNSLFVKFDLSRCGESGPLGSVNLQCQESTGTASVQAGGKTYQVAVKKDANGAWVTDGPVTSDGKAPKAAAPVVKPKVTAVVAKVSPTPRPATPAKATKPVAAPVALPAPVPAPLPAPVVPPVESLTVSTPAPLPSVSVTVASPAPTAPAPAPTPAAAPSGLNVKGNFRLRYEENQRTDASTIRKLGLLRLRLDMAFNPDPAVTVFAQPQFSKTLGEPVYVGRAETATDATTKVNTKTDTSGNNYDTPIGMHQAYLDYHPSPSLKLILGRQILAYGDDVVVSTGDWNNIGRAFDGARARVNYAWGWSDVFAMNRQDNNTTTSGSGDKDFFGLYNGWSFGEAFKAVDLYALHLRDASVTPINGVWALGTRVKSALGAFDYRFEYTNQFGSSAGSQVSGELGYLVHAATKSRVALEGLTATRDYNVFYTSSHKWLGSADILSRRNITSAALRLSTGIVPKLAINLDQHFFWRAHAGYSAYKINGTSTLGSATSAEKYIGMETDLALKYDVTPSTGVTFGAALFFPGATMSDAFGGKKPAAYNLQIDTKF